ncbi:MAG: RHS repeat-associated core domain-containing protein [Saprospiraceae bacterium]
MGNARLSFTDKNNNGIVDVTNITSTNEVLQENHYYAFGMNHEGPWLINQADKDNAYQYNGKEINTDHGLNWSDFGARWYDACVGRFTGVDPIAEKFPHVNPYNYAENKPINNIDLWGLQALPYQAINDMKNQISNAVVSMVDKIGNAADNLVNGTKENAPAVQQAASDIGTAADVVFYVAAAATVLTEGAALPITGPIMTGTEVAGDVAFGVEVAADAVDGNVNTGEIITKAVTGGLSKAADNALSKADLPVPKFSNDPNKTVSNTREVLRTTSKTVFNVAENSISSSIGTSFNVNLNPSGGGRDNTSVAAQPIKPFKKQ